MDCRGFNGVRLSISLLPGMIVVSRRECQVPPGPAQPGRCALKPDVTPSDLVRRVEPFACGRRFLGSQPADVTREPAPAVDLPSAVSETLSSAICWRANSCYKQPSDRSWDDVCLCRDNNEEGEESGEGEGEGSGPDHNL
jgi:hypothetical protein